MSLPPLGHVTDAREGLVEFTVRIRRLACPPSPSRKVSAGGGNHRRQTTVGEQRVEWPANANVVGTVGFVGERSPLGRLRMSCGRNSEEKCSIMSNSRDKHKGHSAREEPRQHMGVKLHSQWCTSWPCSKRNEIQAHISHV